jgi:hypothetical protein
MEKTRKQNKEEARRGIAYKYKGWKGSQRETGRKGGPKSNRTRRGTSGKQDERRNKRATG